MRRSARDVIARLRELRVTAVGSSVERGGRALGRARGFVSARGNHRTALAGARVARGRGLDGCASVVRSSEAPRVGFAVSGARAFASGGAAAERDGDDDSEDESERGEVRSARREPFVIPDEVPYDPPMIRTLLVKHEGDAKLAIASTAREAMEIATKTLEERGYPVGSRQMRIIITKLSSKEETRELIDFMAKMHQIRLSKHHDAKTPPAFGERVGLNLIDYLGQTKDFENLAWVAENLPLLGVHRSNLVAKQLFFNVYTAPLDLVYRVYEACREKYGSQPFATHAMIGSSLDRNEIELAREYADAFKESGARITMKTYFKFLNVATRKGMAELAEWAHDNYLQSLKDSCARRITVAKTINAQMDAGEYKGRLREKLEIDPSWSDPKPNTPFYFLAAAQMHLLKGDVANASAVLNDIPSFEHTHRNLNSSGKSGDEDQDSASGSAEWIVSNVEQEFIDKMSQWPSKMYGEEAFTGEPSAEKLRADLQAAIAGVGRDDIRAVLERIDLDAAFAA